MNLLVGRELSNACRSAFRRYWNVLTPPHRPGILTTSATSLEHVFGAWKAARVVLKTDANRYVDVRESEANFALAPNKADFFNWISSNTSLSLTICFESTCRVRCDVTTSRSLRPRKLWLCSPRNLCRMKMKTRLDSRSGKGRRDETRWSEGRDAIFSFFLAIVELCTAATLHLIWLIGSRHSMRMPVAVLTLRMSHRFAKVLMSVKYCKPLLT